VKISELVRKLANKREEEHFEEETERQHEWKVGFSNMDSRILAKIPDDYLAKLQAGVGPQSAEYLRTQQEWQRRLIAGQVRATFRASVIGVVGTVAGVILGWFLGHR
jgi:hypothetical protein